MGQPQGRHRGGAAGDAGEDALLAHQTARHRHRLLVAHRLDPIDQRQIEVVGHEAGADALDLVRPGPQALAGDRLADHRTVDRLHGHRHQRPAERLLDVAADAGDRAAGADTRHQHIHASIGVLPDLRAGGVVVNAGIGRIHELLQHDVAIRIGFGQLAGGSDRPAHPHAPFGEHQPRPVGGEQLAALQAHRLRHGQRQRDPPRGRHEGQGDAGVAAGGLDQLLAGPEQAILLRLPDHRRADAALDRIRGIAPLDLGQDPGSGPRTDAIQLHQGCTTDAETVIGVDGAHQGGGRAGLIWRHPSQGR